MNVTKLEDKRCGLCEGYIKPLRHPETNEIVWEGGHNALPIADVRCCDDCNTNRVIPVRMAQMQGKLIDDIFNGQRSSDARTVNSDCSDRCSSHKS